MGLREVKQAQKPKSREVPLLGDWLTLRIPQAWHSHLKHLAVEHGHNKGAYVRHIIRLHLKRKGYKP